MPSDERDRPAEGFPEPPGADPDDRTRDRDPHHALNNPATDPDPTEWPDPYERREDPLDPDNPPPPGSGATSNSQPHPQQDPEVANPRPPDRDRADR